MSRNIIFIILDAARKDYFDEYAPRLQSLSDVSFSQCRAASSCSVPSHASILTGKLSHQHGLHSTNVDYAALDTSDTFLSRLPDHTTLGVSANTFAGSTFGFDTHFDSFTNVSWTRRFPEGMDTREYKNRTEVGGLKLYTGFLRACLGHDAPVESLANGVMTQLDLLSSKSPFPRLADNGGKSVLKQARRQIRENSEPFFMFMNLMDIHTPHKHILGYDRSLHDVPSSWNSIEDIDMWEINLNPENRDEEDIKRFRSLYAAAIDYLDRIVAEFVEDVIQDTNNETTFVITSDHGENLGFEADEKLIGHNSSLSEGLLHVPLEVINPPAGCSETETEYVSQLQLGELLVGLSHEETPDVFVEEPVAERLTTPSVPDGASEAFWKRTLRCRYREESKLVWDSQERTIEYGIDHSRPCWQERTSEKDGIPDEDETYFDIDIKTAYNRLVKDDSTLTDVDKSTKERLRELGYL